MLSVTVNVTATKSNIIKHNAAVKTKSGMKIGGL